MKFLSDILIKAGLVVENTLSLGDSTSQKYNNNYPFEINNGAYSLKMGFDSSGYYTRIYSQAGLEIVGQSGGYFRIVPSSHTSIFDSTGFYSSNAANSIYAGTSGELGFYTYGSSTAYGALKAVYIDNLNFGFKGQYVNGGTVGEGFRLFSNGNFSVGSSTDSGYKFYVLGLSKLQGNSVVTGTLTVSDTVTSGNGTINTSMSYGASFGVIGTSSNHALQIRTNNTTAIHLSETGNVGVGGTAAYKFDVFGTARIQGTLNAREVSPSTNNTYNLGSGGNKWQSLYVHTINGSGTLLSLTANASNQGIRIYDGAQYSGLVNITDGGYTTDDSAVLKVSSTTRGFLQPKMTTTQRDAIYNPSAGLSIFNTTTNTHDIYISGVWVSLATQGFVSGAYVPTLRTITINGTAYDLSADRSWTISDSTKLPLSGGTLTGGLTGTSATFSSSITANSFIKSGGTSAQILMADGSVLTAGTNITISGGTISASGGGGGVTSFNTRTGAVTLSSSDVTTALGFTPYNSSNPSGYITSSALSSYLPLSGGTLAGNLQINPASATWAEGLSFNMPTVAAWGGLRWLRGRSGYDGNWAVGYTGLDNSDDLVFVANNGGTQVNNILRLTKAGVVTVNGGTVITSSNIGSQSVSYASSAGNADTVDGYHGSNYLGKNGNSYYQQDTWIQIGGHYGLYSTTNNARLFPNNQSYGSWKVLGDRGGWRGLHFGEGTGMTLMMNETEFGFHRESIGWYARFTAGTGDFSITGNAASASSVAWGNVSSKPSNIIYYDTWYGSSYYGSNGDIYMSWLGWLSNNINQSVRTESSPYFTGMQLGASDLYVGTNYGYNWRDWGGWGGYWFNRNGGDMIMNLYALYAVTGGISDIRYKKHVTASPYGLKEVMQMNPIKYHYNLPKESMLANDPDFFLGFSAQEIQELVPEAVHEKIGEDTDSMKGMLAITYDELIPVTVQAIKEQQAIINTQASRIERLETLINQLTNN
jgi:hypothetical protein